MLLPFTAGTFLYVGTVAVIPELLETGPNKGRSCGRPSCSSQPLRLAPDHALHLLARLIRFQPGGIGLAQTRENQDMSTWVSGKELGPPRREVAHLSKLPSGPVQKVPK